LTTTAILVNMPGKAAHRLDSPYVTGVFFESDAELASFTDWVVPLALVRAMAVGMRLDISAPLSARLAQNLETIQDIYAAWIPGFKHIVVDFPTTQQRQPASGVSLFFSGGVDSFYSLVKHRAEIDNLILVHGFDVPLADTKSFGLAEARAQEAARLFGKRLIIVRTNLRSEQMPNLPCEWRMYHGAALATVAHSLAPQHSKIYLASGHSYANPHPRGSHPLLDPLWSSEAVELVHDGGETRVDKLRRLVLEPEVISRIRVCWQNSGEYNCGRCEKCLRTMLAIRGLGLGRCSAFPDTLAPGIVRQQELSPDALLFWRELTHLDLPSDLASAVRSAVRSAECGLPPHSGTLRREVRRGLCALGQIVRVLRSLT
jgi:7-cyano-7-deazaguanine synthase in queuosine biosynthesis